MKGSGGDTSSAASVGKREETTKACFRENRKPGGLLVRSMQGLVSNQSHVLKWETHTQPRKIGVWSVPLHPLLSVGMIY